MMRWLWSLYLPIFAATLVYLLAMALGPAIEERVAPVRVDQRIEEVERFPDVFRFVWVNCKRRRAPFVDIDVSLVSERDRFVVTLFRDVSEPGEARCTRIIPWSHSGQVGLGPHRQPFCVEIPRAVKPAEKMSLSVVGRYKGLFGLWQVKVEMPPIDIPPAATATKPAPAQL